MNNLALNTSVIPSMSEDAINKVRILEEEVGKMPQIELLTDNIIHGGMYARTIKIPAGGIVAGALIKVATILIVSGDAVVYVGDASKEVHGYNIFAASSNRKQAVLALSDLYCTMIFPSNAKTVKEAEHEFTDEVSNLMTNKFDNKLVTNLITGE